MTATSLSALAAWDVALLRSAISTLDGVADRLPAWRAHVETVGRDLETARVWSGPAARTAAGAVLELSAVTTAVSSALGESLAAFGLVLGAAEAAQDAAATALALAAAEQVPLDDDGTVVAPQLTPAMAPDQAAAVAQRAVIVARVGALAARAMEAAAAVAVAAEDADRALLPAGAVHARPPADFADLAGRVPDAVVVPVVPVGRAPENVARWWAALSAADQRAAIASAPDLVGALDGVPAWARDRANRLLLASALDAGSALATVVTDEIARQEQAGRSVQLWTFDPDADLVALAVGDLDTAGAVSVLVPGIRTTPEDDLTGQVAHARDLAAEAEAAAPGLAVAAMAWIGYRTPQGLPSILTRGDARRGGAALDRALDGLDAARQALAAADPRTTVVAHSYGTVVVDEAAGAEGELAADAVVLLGSPGLSRNAGRLEVAQVYGAASPADPISWSGYYGQNTWAEEFGASELPVDPGTAHWDYFDRDRPTLGAMGEVVAGTGPR
ncbi:alpha/beta hydrolase [Geodermatophilus sp. URMC 64]